MSTSQLPETVVRQTADFQITGDGTSSAWKPADWVEIPRLNGNASYATRAKLLYSGTGLYFLFDCVDERLSASMTGQYQRIYTEDVVELFLWPDESQRLYFEYEISPLGAELPLLVPNHGGRFMGWIPWEYEGERKIQSATRIRGGEKSPGAAITGWSAEIFIPYALLEKGMGNVPPRPGTRWRANLYRIDYDAKPTTHWAWSRVSGSFHDFNNFGHLVFA